MKNHFISLTHEVEDAIMEYIDQNGLRPGDKLPSERVFCGLLGISRNTYRAAVKELLYAGELFQKPGRCCEVARPRIRQNLWAFDSLSVFMKQMGFTHKRKVISFHLMETDKALSQKLAVPIGTEIACLNRVSYIDNEPGAYEISYLKSGRLPGIMQYDFAEHSLYDVLYRDYGIVLKRQFIEVFMVFADEKKARWLKVHPGAPVLSDSALAFDDAGSVIEYSITSMDAARFEFEGISRKE